MSTIVYRICALLDTLLQRLPIGTNLALFHLFFALLSGRLLNSRGALAPALSDLGLSEQAVRRSMAALTYGDWDIHILLAAWQRLLHKEGRFHVHCYEGFRPVACDLVGFFRPHLRGCLSKHYASGVAKALPAVVVGLLAGVGSVGKKRLAVPRLVVEATRETHTDATLSRYTLEAARRVLKEDEVLLTDAGFPLSDLLEVGMAAFVVRLPKNFTARRNYLPVYKGRGAHAQYGERVRPLSRTRKAKTVPATPADSTTRWTEGGRELIGLTFHDLVLSKAKPGSASFRVVVIHDPRYVEALVLSTNLPERVSVYWLWHLYRDRWPIEQLPLAAKQMLGAQRAFVFAKDSRVRLPQVALLAGNLVSYVAATSACVSSGFWDRCAQATCGRLRRCLYRVNSSQLPVLSGRMREKASVTAHLPKGVKGHRRSKSDHVARIRDVALPWAA